MSAEQKTISWTRPMLTRFRAEYRKHHNEPSHSTFMFEGNEYVVGYAKYLIEHLETIFPNDVSRN